jgi:SAM-dependent methyltransferase
MLEAIDSNIMGAPIKPERYMADDHISNICPLCLSTEVEINILPYPLFRHMDFSPFHPGPNKIGQCRVCQSVFRVIDDDEQMAIDAIYTGEEYLRHEEPHTIVIEGYDAPQPISFFQAKLLAPFLAGKEPSVLDIGCFDGRLLFEIGKVCDARDLCGFDVSERPRFPRDSKFRFVCGHMGSISGQFDIILMSHSIQYIRNIHELFQRIRSLLKPGGQLFVQVPDYSVKPCSLLLGDLYYHYDQTIMKNMFRHMGFNTIFLDNPYFPRDILVVASPGTKEMAAGYSEEFHLKTGLARIAEMAERLDQLTTFDALGVLGTTSEAAFISYYLGVRVSFFVDENPKKVGTDFQGKPVIHPKSVLEKDIIVIPMGKVGEGIRERLSKKYSGKYICL